MKYAIQILVFAFWCSFSDSAEKSGKVACFYNSDTLNGLDISKVGPEELKPALSACDYLVYGYAGINEETYQIASLNPGIDLKIGADNYHKVTNLTKFSPKTKFLVSIGGFHDWDDKDKYLKVLEKQTKRGELINSIVKLVKEYDFHGVDLGWQFPLVSQKKNRTVLGKIWHSIKKIVNSGKDDKEKEHKDQFNTFVKELAAALRGENKILTLSILPHVNVKAYYDPATLVPSVEHIHLMTLDYRIPERDEEEADYSAPLQYVYDRVPDENVQSTVAWWKENNFPAQKLFIAVPTYGRTWKITKASGKSGIPPMKHADGPGEAGPYLQTPGLMSHYELCPLLVVPSMANDSVTLLQRIPDASKRQGTYAFRAATDDHAGIWVSYDDPEVAAQKAQFVKSNGLGGVAVVDITMDDFKGSCDNTHTPYPILKAVAANL